MSESMPAQNVNPALRESRVTNQPSITDPNLARQLVLDELFDLSLYQSLRNVANGQSRAILDQLIPIEQRHFTFFQDCFKPDIETTDPARRLKLLLLVPLCRLFSAP